MRTIPSVPRTIRDPTPLCRPRHAHVRSDAYGSIVDTNDWDLPVIPKDRLPLTRLIRWECRVNQNAARLSFASKIDRWVHNPTVSEEMARTRITDVCLELRAHALTRMQQEPSWTPTLGWWKLGLRNGTHLEHWFQTMGMPATYLRVGKHYLKFKALLPAGASGIDLDHTWDRGVQEYLTRHGKSGRWARWSDGRSSNPSRANDPKNQPDPTQNGRIIYEQAFRDLMERLEVTRSADRSIDEQITLSDPRSITDDTWFDADLCERHCIDLTQLDALDGPTLAELGISPATFNRVRNQLAQRSAGKPGA